MKTSIKLAVSSALVAASGMMALPALADTALPSSGNGELVLYVYNSVTDTTYARGLGVTMNSLLTQGQIQSSGYAGVTLTENVSLPTLGPDPTLTTFLAADPASDYSYAILGGDSTYTGSGVATAGDLRYVTTTTQTLTGLVGGDKTNSNLKSLFSNLEPVTQVAANAAINSGVVGDKASGVGATGEIFSPNLSPNPQIWYGANLLNTVALGSSSNLYMLATNGGLTGTAGTNSTQAEDYQFNNVTLSTSGTLSSAGGSAVPLPAAVWLLGSGLIGLAGIGRRRRANPV